MKLLVKHLKTFLFFFLLATLAGSCRQQKKETASENTTNAELADLLLAIDSVNQEISAGDYGLIDRFMVFKNNELLADYTYTNDYATLAQLEDTTDHQYNYDHPNWHPFYQGSKLHTLQSCTKSVNSILMGIALERHPEYSVDTKFMTLMPDYELDNPDPRIYDITLEDLLTMRAGFQWNEGEYQDMNDDCIVMEASDDWIEFVLNKPFDSNPGEKWVYNSGVSVLIGKALRIITGKKADEYAEEVLFGPLGITEYHWKHTPKGEVDTEGGLYLKSEDLAKIGALYLNNGKWEGEQIVPEKWVQASVNPKVTNLYPEAPVDVGYGYQWWTEDYNNGEIKVFTANGYGGQYIMVLPREDMYVVFNAWNHKQQPEKPAFFVFTQRLIPALQ